MILFRWPELLMRLLTFTKPSRDRKHQGNSGPVRLWSEPELKP